MTVSSARRLRRNWTRWVMVASLFACSSCMSNKSFEEIAPGVGVPRQSIDDYAEQHGISRQEAKQKMAAELSSPTTQDTDDRGTHMSDGVAGQERNGEPAR